MLIQTSRLDLRQIEVEDAEFILELMNEPDYVRFIGDKCVRSKEDAQRYIERVFQPSYVRSGYGLYAVVEREGLRPVGICGLVKREGLDDPDLGFALRREFWSRSYASEAASAVIEFAGRGLGLRRLMAVCAPDNVRSIGLLSRLGFASRGLSRLTTEGPELRIFERPLESALEWGKDAAPAPLKRGGPGRIPWGDRG